MYISQNPDRFQSILHGIIAVNSVLILTATFGNGLIILSVFKTPSLHTPSYILITSMAMGDMLVGLVLHPILIVLTIAILKGNSALFCYSSRGMDFVTQYLGTLSFVMSLLISIDRYLALTLKTRYRQIVSKRRVLLLILLSWASLFVSTMVSQAVIELRQNLLEILGTFGLLALLAISTFYFLSFRCLYKFSLQVELNHNAFDVQKYRKSLKTMMIIFVCLLLSYVPLICMPFLRIYLVEGNHKFGTVFYGYATISLGLNSTVNPLVYIVRFQDIRKACRQTLKLLW